MKTLLLTCDFEEFDLPFDFNKNISEKLMLEKSYEGIQRFLALISKYEFKMSFFVTTRIAEAYPDLLRKIAKDGHEIGLHASIDKCKKKDFANDTIVSDIRLAKDKLEKIIMMELYGFKNHKLAVLPTDILGKTGFVYDNTCHPTYVPGRYFNIFHTRKITTAKEGVLDIPISVTPICRLPISWIWFRSFGLNYAKFCTSWIYGSQDYINIYFHSWDFADISDNSYLRLPYLLTRNDGMVLIKMLGEYIDWCISRKIKANTIYNYLKANNYLAKNSK